MSSEPTTIGLSEEAHICLQRLEEEGHFERMVDAYRFAVALALAHGGIARDTGRGRTVFNVGTLDPDGSLYAAVSALRNDAEEPVYRTIEHLAEWGVMELARLADQGEINFGNLLKEAEQLLVDDEPREEGRQ